MNKEEIYDKMLSPLMVQVIAICKSHSIAMLAQFSIPTEEEPDLACTTGILTKDCEPPEHMVEAFGLLKRGGRPAPLNLKIEGPDKTTMVTIV